MSADDKGTLPSTASGRAATPLSQQSDVALFEEARLGHYQAFEEIVHRYRDRIYRLAFGMMHNATDTEEVVQETFLNAFRKIDSFRGESSPSSWLFRVAVNAALMRLRSRRRKATVSLDDRSQSESLGLQNALWAVGDWARKPDDQLLSHELGEHIEQAIRALPEKLRVVLLLRDVEGQSNEEVAHTLGLTVATVKARLHRSRLFVRQHVEAYFRGGA